MKYKLNPLMFALPLSVISCKSSVNERASGEKPNIIIIYTDDVGYGDIGCYGAKEVQTPNIDRLALKGLRFTNAYATSSTSTPSRYSLLTGEYHWRKPPGWNVGELKGTSIAPGDAGMLIPTDMNTIPSILKEQGYSTAVIGKWHLGLGPVGGPDWNGIIKPSPEDIGFDYSFLLPATGDRVPCVYVENRKVVGLDPDDPIHVSYNEPIGDDSTIYNPAVTPGTIVSYNKPGATNAGYFNQRKDIKMHPSFGHDQTIVNGISRIGFMTGGFSARWKDEEIAETLVHKALNFIEKNKNERFFLYFSTHDVHVPRVPGARFAGKSAIGIYGDVIMQMDWCVGEIMNKLEELKLTNNTLVIFTSDNGPVLDDGYHDGSVEYIGDHKPAGPFRGGKYSAFEGGTKVPMIVYWPDRVKNGITNALFSQIDFLASLAAISGYKRKDRISMDSENNLSTLLGDEKNDRDYVIQHNMGGTLSIIKDKWKYIEPGDGPKLNPYTRPQMELGNDPKPQLYDLSVDKAETNNLAEKFPDIVSQLYELLEKEKSR